MRNGRPVAPAFEITKIEFCDSQARHALSSRSCGCRMRRIASVHLFITRVVPDFRANFGGNFAEDRKTATAGHVIELAQDAESVVGISEVRRQAARGRRRRPPDRVAPRASAARAAAGRPPVEAPFVDERSHIAEPEGRWGSRGRRPRVPRAGRREPLPAAGRRPTESAANPGRRTAARSHSASVGRRQSPPALPSQSQNAAASSQRCRRPAAAGARSRDRATTAAPARCRARWPAHSRRSSRESGRERTRPASGAPGMGTTAGTTTAERAPSPLHGRAAADEAAASARFAFGSSVVEKAAPARERLLDERAPRVEPRDRVGSRRGVRALDRRLEPREGAESRSRLAGAASERL